jgi:RND family efflux transporter MFP subunit
MKAVTKRAAVAATPLFLFFVGACGMDAPGGKAGRVEAEGWAVTAWGGRYEVFAETDPLVAEETAVSNPHVTILDGFAPLREGSVTVILRGAGTEERFSQSTPKRDGIFPVSIRPRAEGDFELRFLIEGPAGSEEIAAGRVRVGTAAAPGGPAPDAEGEGDGDIPFLKEQQWRTAFATAPVTEGAFRDSVSGPGRLTPAAGGEVTLTATFAAVVASEPWPYPGLDVARGRTIFHLHPRAGERSLPDLRADAAALEAEVETARRRAGRLADLLKLEATSAAELERARAELAGLEARLRAARQGVEAAAGPAGAGSGAAVAVAAPWAGRIAEVAVSPGEAVAPGTRLARLVKVRPIWMTLALRPEEAGRVRGRPSGLLFRPPGADGAVEIGAEDLRVVARAPEVDPQTATIGLILEIDRGAAEHPLGSVVEAELLLAGERRGIVVPDSALIDDAGVLVVYLQRSGEGFERREVRVLARRATQALVEGLRPGERLVTRGGGAVRRSALLSSGPPEGHIH